MINKKRPNPEGVCGGEESKEERLARSEESRSYYYDDAHGYEEFDPEADVEEEHEDEAAP